MCQTEIFAMGCLKRNKTERWLRTRILDPDYPDLNPVSATY